MPKNPRSTSGYARIAQVENEEDDEYQDDEAEGGHQRTLSFQNPLVSQPRGHSPMRPIADKANGTSTRRKRARHGLRKRSNSAVDIKAINLRLEKWADEIAQKFRVRKIKGKTAAEERLEIHHSVFQAPDDIRPATADTLARMALEQPLTKMTKMQFDDTVESVRVAIELGTHPKMITQGSSGSYFAKDSEGKTVGVFKPKDEEPYASKNPKWTKWIHRNLFPFFFGRACLIPNLSYISEAAAYVLDSRLQTNIVPYTDIVYFSSISFNYDYWDRRAYYRKKKPLPQKVGSLQVFLRGFKDANLFLKEHPWPDQNSYDLQAGTESRTKKKRRRWAEECRPGSVASDDEDENIPTSTAATSRATSRAQSRRRDVFWTPALQESLREQLEKLVILDYIMRNTDRGLDNWMIRIDHETEEATIVAEPPRNETAHGNGAYEGQPDMRADGVEEQAGEEDSQVSLGAIDNSLSWPWKHPDAWRSFPFGWLFLPVSLIGQPFSEKTRQHFLPLLTSKHWWSETQVALRECFSQDSDFQERMYARQIAVMKGQAWNVVETLKTKDHGPLELTRRQRVCVWDDLVDVPVVVPLRQPSEEMQRQRDEAANQSHDEADIGAFKTGRKELPNPKRFTLSPRESQDVVSRPDSEDSPALESASASLSTLLRSSGTPKADSSSKDARPLAGRSRARVSYEEPRRTWNSAEARKRNLSFSTRRVSDVTVDDYDGDLGYAVAQGREGNRKRVIVERLETVKGRNPVFTWC